MTRMMPSDPIYEKVNTLQHIIMTAVNRAPFTEFEHMPEPERQVAIAALLEEQGDELQNVDRRQINFLN